MDANLTGSLSIVGDRKMDLDLSAKTNLGLLQNFSQDIYSSGNIALGATVRGTVSKPLVTGKLELKNASVNHVNLPNGISNANGLIVFNGNTATVRTLTAQSGGGKVGMTGFVAMGDQFRLGLRATANSVRVRMQQGVSVVVSAFVERDRNNCIEPCLGGHHHQSHYVRSAERYGRDPYTNGAACTGA